MSICVPRQRVTSFNNSPSAELHHRQPPSDAKPSTTQPQPPPLMSHNSFVKQAVYGNSPHPHQPIPPGALKQDDSPRLLGLPLKYVSLFTLALQNAALAIIMHYSRVSTPPDRAYSAASAVLLNELLKGSISLLIALLRIDDNSKSRTATTTPPSAASAASGYKYNLVARSKKVVQAASPPSIFRLCARWVSKWRRLGREVFSPDCWKLSIPAILYVIQNNLQFVAASNLDAATFQVTYQMKILTTAAFSVLLLNRRLTSTKWLALLGLALGVGIVQIQTQPFHHSPPPQTSSANETHKIVQAMAGAHVMNPLKGFLAVAMACLTSGLAGVYFEMVLKGSQADLWVRNVQLSLFSLLPALVPVLFSQTPSGVDGHWFWDLFKNFGVWAWATVLIQVFGGLVTAVVIKYADNIMKGFATSLSIIISFLVSVAIFDFSITVPFVLGSSVVLASTWVYNKPESKGIPASSSPNATATAGSAVGLMLDTNLATTPEKSRRPSTLPGSPIEADAPILGQYSPPKKKSAFATPSTRSIASAFGLGSRSSSSERVGLGPLTTITSASTSNSRAGSAAVSRSNSIEHIQAGLAMTPANNDVIDSRDVAASPYRSGATTPTFPPSRPNSTRPYPLRQGSGDNIYRDSLQPNDASAGWKAA